MKLLIAGIPATRKTTLGDYLQAERGFLHLDFEATNSWPSEIQRKWGSQLDRLNFLKNPGTPLVITWGFMPGTPDEMTVREFQDLGFKFIWFDGNREAARREFIKRGTVPVEALDNQMMRINNLDLDSFNPIIVNTFDGDGGLLPIADIVSIVLG